MSSEPVSASAPVQEPSASTSRRTALLCAAVLGVVVFLLYLPTLRFGLVYDDNMQIVDNFRLTNWSYLPGYFSNHLWAHMGDQDDTRWYRPLFLVWLRLCYALFGPPSSLWHLPSVLAHAAASISLFALIRKMTGNLRAAFVSAAVFAVHPINTEPVAWISAAEDPMVTTLLVLCVYFFITKKAPISLPSLLCALLAMLTKEIGVVALGLVFLYEWTHASLKRAAVAVIPYVICTGFYFSLRINAVGRSSVVTQHHLTFGAMMLTWPRLLWHYASHLLWPLRLSVIYETPVGTAIWPLLLLLVVGAGGVFALRKAQPAVRFGALWCAVTLIPALQIWSFRNSDIAQLNFVHDRYLYLPLAGVLIIAACLLARLQFTPPQVSIAAAVLGAFVLITIQHLPVWRSDRSLFEHSLAFAPRNQDILNDLGLGYMKEGRYGDCVSVLRREIELAPDNATYFNNLGVCYQYAGDPVNAENAWRTAARLRQISGEN